MRIRPLTRMQRIITVAAIAGIVVGIWQGYLPVAKEKGWWPYSPPSADIRIIDVQFDAPGNDDVNNLNGEWVEIQNFESTAVPMSGWMLCDYQNNHVYRFRNFTLTPGATVKIYSGSDTDSQTELYWEHGDHIWNNGGDTATLLDSNGGWIHEWEE